MSHSPKINPLVKSEESSAIYLRLSLSLLLVLLSWDMILVWMCGCMYPQEGFLFIVWLSGFSWDSASCSRTLRALQCRCLPALGLSLYKDPPTMLPLWKPIVSDHRFFILKMYKRLRANWNTHVWWHPEGIHMETHFVNFASQVNQPCVQLSNNKKFSQSNGFLNNLPIRHSERISSTH